MYTTFYNLFQSYKVGNVKYFMEKYGYNIGWNAMLGLVSLVIIWFMISSWGNLTNSNEFIDYNA